MFSARTLWDPSANALTQALESRRGRGFAVLDLTESNPTRVGLGFPGEALSRALANEEAASYQPDPLGLLAAREAIAGYYRDRGLVAPVEQVVVTSSTSEAYAFLFKLLADPGDEVLVPLPSYPLFEFLAGLESVRTVGYPLRYDGEWHIDREGLRAAAGPRTRAIVAVSPNNPTGSFLKEAELAFLDGFCAERSLSLLCDEVFADFPLEAPADRISGVLGRTRALSFTLNGASKIAALPQLKIGWLVASGPPALVEPAMQRLELIADTYLSPSTPSQLALPQVLSQRALAQGPLLERLEQNLGALRALHGVRSSWQPLRVEGGWSAVLQVPNTLSEQDWALRLLDEGVLVHPGYFYDFPKPAFLAVSLIVRPEVLDEGLARVARCLDAA